MWLLHHVCLRELLKVSPSTCRQILPGTHPVLFERRFTLRLIWELSIADLRGEVLSCMIDTKELVVVVGFET